MPAAELINTTPWTASVAADKVPRSASQSLTGAFNYINAHAPVATSLVDLATIAANAVITLPNGTQAGQRKKFVLSTASATHTATITPTTLADTGVTHATLTNRFDAVELEWTTAGWRVLGITGAAAVA